MASLQKFNLDLYTNKLLEMCQSMQTHTIETVINCLFTVREHVFVLWTLIWDYAEYTQILLVMYTVHFYLLLLNYFC